MGFEFDDICKEVKLPDSTVGATARLSASSITNPIDFALYNDHQSQIHALNYKRINVLGTTLILNSHQYIVKSETF